MIRHIPHHAAWLCVVIVLTLAPCARAGSVLLSRESDLRASGASAGGEYDMSNGTADFSEWADGLLSDGDAPARSSAQQHSAPKVGDSGALSGASAEGSARASVDPGADDAFSDAATDFDLFFTVDQKPALLKLDATLAAGGDATTGVALRRATDTDHPVIAIDVTEQSQTVSEQTVLQPGTYGLSVWAFARGTPGESLASYTVSVTLADAQAGVTPVPLPATAWAGAAGLSVVALLVARMRRTVARQ